MPFVTIAKENAVDVKLYYEDCGEGTPAVLIHGYPLSSSSWEKQVQALVGAGHRVITYDRRGFGKSSQPTGGYDYDTFTEDLHKLVIALDLRDVTLVGFSMGGGEVARYFLRYGSEGVRKAVFISGAPPCRWHVADGAKGADRTGLQKIVTADRYSFFNSFSNNFYNADVLMGTCVSEQAIEASWNEVAHSLVTAANACVATWYEEFDEDLDCIDVPTLVIHGDADRIAPITALSGPQGIQKIAGAKLFGVKNGPHGIIWTHADEVNGQLINFLADGTATPVRQPVLAAAIV